MLRCCVHGLCLQNFMVPDNCTVSCIHYGHIWTSSGRAQMNSEGNRKSMFLSNIFRIWSNVTKSSEEYACYCFKATNMLH